MPSIFHRRRSSDLSNTPGNTVSKEHPTPSAPRGSIDLAGHSHDHDKSRTIFERREINQSDSLDSRAKKMGIHLPSPSALFHRHRESNSTVVDANATQSHALVEEVVREIETPSPEFASWPALQPSLPSPTASHLLTPPSSAPSLQSISVSPIHYPTSLPSPASCDNRPTLSVETQNLVGDKPSANHFASLVTPISQEEEEPFPLAGPSTPARPVSGRKTSLVLQSPPMPRPIANLPTLNGWAGFSPGPGNNTPSWGTLAREGGPKTPGITSPRTPGPSGGFPFFTSLKDKGTLTDAELRKATKAMPVMLREPSRGPEANGRAGDDDDEDDDVDEDDEDSDDVEGSNSPISATTSPIIVNSFSLRRGTKSMAPMESVQEEAGPSRLFDRRRAAPINLDGILPSPPAMGSNSLKSVWSLPTPKQQDFQSGALGWTVFVPETPVESDGERGEDGEEAISAPSPQLQPPSPQSQPPLHTVQEARLLAPPVTFSRTTSASTSNGSYFESQPGTSQPGSSEISLGEGEPSTPRGTAPSLPRGTGAELAASATAVLPHGDSDGDSIEGSEEMSSTAPSLDHSGAFDRPSPSDVSSVTTPPQSPSRPVIYAQVSQSMINLPTGDGVREGDCNFSRPIPPRLEAIPSTEAINFGSPTSATVSSNHNVSSPTAEIREAWLRPPPTPATGLGQCFWAGHSQPPLKRRLSAGDAAPPRYEPMPKYNNEAPAPKPRDEEGQEKLPGYWCGVHIEGTLTRKVEFIRPQVQARDRSWKKLYFVLHGTALYVYKFDPLKVPLRSGERYITVTEDEAEDFLHVHCVPDRRSSVAGSNPASSARARDALAPRRATVGSESRRTSLAETLAARRAATGSPGRGQSETTSPLSGADAKDLALFKAAPNAAGRRASNASSLETTASRLPMSSHLPFAHNTVVQILSLHGAESGLAADYKKRSHCVRVRAEGQQFMLQCDTARQCVQWVEAFQAATNVAMDLDCRPMPVQQTLPRRRRRRVAGGAGANGGATATNNGVSTVDTPEGNAAAVANAERAERERAATNRMLVEDQRANLRAGETT